MIRQSTIGGTIYMMALRNSFAAEIDELNDVRSQREGVYDKLLRRRRRLKAEG